MTPQKHVWRCAIMQHRQEQDHGVALAGALCGGRGGRPVRRSDAQMQAVLTRTLQPPPDGASHWTSRRMEQEVGLDHTTVHRI